METALKIGISACLLGEPVRYDGGHKLDQFLVETLGRFVSFVPVCPETECRLGVPREAMRRTCDPTAPHVRKYKESYPASQIYLNPHPLELKLRNHV